MARPFASLGRLREITAIVAKHGLDHYQENRRERAKARRDGLREDPVLVIPKLATRFRAILEDLGPTFIKFGQVLSTRADLLPAGFAEALASLRDNVPPMTAIEASQVVEAALGKPIARLFKEFDPEPSASASIAQVHRAITYDGFEVAVKIQRPGVREKILTDLDLLHYLAKLVETIVYESGVVTAGAIVDEFEAAFLNEVDFEREARTLKRFFANTQNGQRSYVVPKVFDELSVRTVLTMEFVHGCSISNIGPQHDREAIASNLVRAAFEQTFVDGLFHADPHPGNVFVLSDNRLALLDFGCVGQISYAMRETLVALVVAIGARDAETVARLLYRVGVPNKRVLLHRLRDACASLFGTYLRDQTTLSSIESAQVLRELFNMAASFGIRLPSEYALLARASVVTEGVIRQLDPKFEVLKTLGPYVRRLIEEQFAMPEVSETALRGVIRARGLLSELPLMASQILMDLESGKLQVQFENRKLETIAQNIDALGVTIFFGLIAGGLVLGGSVLLQDYPIEIMGLPVIPLVCFLGASLLFAGVFGRYLIRPRIRKISLRRFFKVSRRS